MIRCNETIKLIDESDNPEMFSYEAARHIASCLSCKDFAEERARLRNLLAMSLRVSVPANFDALLEQRLAAARSRRSPAHIFAWAGPAGYLKFGAATAAIIIGVFAASYSGLFSSPPQNKKMVAATGDSPPVVTSETQEVKPPPPPVVSDGIQASFVAANSSGRRVKPAASRPPVSVAPEIVAEDTQTVLLRGEDFEREVPMPTVSFGAQPLMYVGKARNTSGGMRASF